MKQIPGFKLHPGAEQDLSEIWEYIAQDSPLSAERVRGEIVDAVRKLVNFPLRGFLRSNITTRSLRFHVVRNFLIVYAPNKKPIVVVAVLHASRSPRSLAAILRGRQ
jgi:plasmid stabilization system protein ParE